MDLLSEVLRYDGGRAVMLSRHVYRGPWGIEFGTEPRARAGLHYVESGGCWLRHPGAPPSRLGPGDVVLFPTGLGHALSDAPRRRTQPLEAFLAGEPRSEDEPENARIMCAARTEGPERTGVHPLLRELPPVIYIDAGTVQACPSLSPCLHLLVQELRCETPGRARAVELLLDALILYVVRNWLDRQVSSRGWVGALRDQRIARALTALHGAPEAPWTVADLARSARMSAPGFARRFRETVGVSPLTYLTDVRMRRAAGILRTSEATLAEVAARVGYTSEFAFSRAFKRTMGSAPTVFRSMVISEVEAHANRG